MRLHGGYLELRESFGFVFVSRLTRTVGCIDRKTRVFLFLGILFFSFISFLLLYIFFIQRTVLCSVYCKWSVGLFIAVCVIRLLSIAQQLNKAPCCER